MVLLVLKFISVLKMFKKKKGVPIGKIKLQHALYSKGIDYTFHKISIYKDLAKKLEESSYSLYRRTLPFFSQVFKYKAANAITPYYNNLKISLRRKYVIVRLLLKNLDIYARLKLKLEEKLLNVFLKRKKLKNDFYFVPTLFSF